jgi:hypothetical protein
MCSGRNIIRSFFFSLFDFSKFESPAEIISRLLAHEGTTFSPFTIRDERNGNSIQLR